MLPVPRLASQIEQEWAEELASRFGCTAEEMRANPARLINFPSGILRIKLTDASMVEFRRAFHIVSESKKTIAVFTEHCGHHLFPCHEAQVYRDGDLVFHQNYESFEKNA